MDSGLSKGMMTVIEFEAEDPKLGLTLGELNTFMEKVNRAHAGYDVKTVQITVRTGFKSQIRRIKGEIRTLD